MLDDFMKKLIREPHEPNISPGFCKHQPLSERLVNPISEEKLEYLKKFIFAKMGRLDNIIFENAMIILGDGETIQKRAVGPLSFYALLADAKTYYAVVHGYYNPGTSILSYFSGCRPENELLKSVSFIVDFDRDVMGERIIKVRFDGSENLYLKALEGLQVSGGFASASLL